LTVINDILDFSKIESGKLELEPIDFVLRTALEEVADLLAERAQSKGLEMACLIHHDIPEVVSGDPGRLRQILTNLLGNAIKFTQTGEVVLRARLAEDAVDTVMIRFEITDTASVSPTKGGATCFSRFHRPTRRPRASTGARVLAWPFRSALPSSWAETSGWKASRARAARSGSRSG
jgi:K+-sensing histidine kinase KdpD